MKRLGKIAGIGATLIFVGSLLTAQADEMGLPKKIRLERETKQEAEKAQREKMMTPEAKAKREAAAARRRAVFDKYVIHPIQKVKNISFQRPSRRPDSSPEGKAARKAAAERRREDMKERVGKLIPKPHRPAHHSATTK